MNESTAIDIYKVFKSEELMCLNLHRQYSQQYFTLIVAILAASLLALYHFKDNLWIMLFILVAPIVNILLSLTAIKMCNRFYIRFLEAITIQVKLEPLIGFSATRPDASEASRPFPEDTHILPERWVTSRKQKKAQDFINDKMKRGSNRWARVSFFLLIVANIAIALIVIKQVIGLPCPG